MPRASFDGAFSLPLYIIIAGLVLLPVTVSGSLPVPSRVLILGAAILLALGAMAVHERPLESAWGGLTAAWCILLAVAVASLANVDERTSTADVLAGVGPLLALAALLPYAYACGRERPDVLRRCADLLVVVGGLLTLLATYQAATGRWPLADSLARSLGLAPTRQGRAATIFAHPARYGTFAGAMALLAVLRQRPLWGPLFVANLFGLLLSGARGAWLAFGVALVIGLVLGVPRGHLAWRPVALGVAVAVLMLALLLLAVPLARHSTGEVSARLATSGSSLSDRGRLLKEGWRRLTVSPRRVLLGYGPGAEERLFGAEGFRITGQPGTFDNAYVNVWYELGLFGLLAIGGLLAFGVAAPGSLDGRILLLFLGINLLAYVGFRWPVVDGLVLLAVGLRAAPRPWPSG